MYDHKKESLDSTIFYQKNSPTSSRLPDRDNDARWNRNLSRGRLQRGRNLRLIGRESREREETRMRIPFTFSPYPVNYRSLVARVDVDVVIVVVVVVVVAGVATPK